MMTGLFRIQSPPSPSGPLFELPFPDDDDVFLAISTTTSQDTENQTDEFVISMPGISGSRRVHGAVVRSTFSETDHVCRNFDELSRDSSP